MVFLQTLGSLHLIHLVITVLFGFLILCFFVRAILSWLPMLSPSNPFVRFFHGVTAPLYEPLYRLLPSSSVGMFDLRSMIAFLFSWWALGVMSTLLYFAIPVGW